MHDVCLIIENSGDMLQSGLPREIQNLVQSLPNLRFAVLSITRKQSSLNSLLGEIPANLAEYVQFIMSEENVLKGKCPRRKERRHFWGLLESLYKAPLEEKTRYFESVVQALAVDGNRVTSYADIINSRKFWDLMMSQYQKYARHIPFIDYVWIWRTSQLPFFQLMHAQIPVAKVYHVLSPRYAACAGLVAKMRYRSHVVFDINENTPLMENLKLETFAIDSNGHQPRSSLSPSTFDVYKKTHNASTKLFHYLASFYADFIIIHNRNPQALFPDEGLRHKYVFVPLSTSYPQKEIRTGGTRTKLSIGLAGEITPHGDIKTAIKAGKLLTDDQGEIRFKILSLGKPNPFYLRECIDLKNSLGMNFTMEIIQGGLSEQQRALSECDLVVFSPCNGSGEQLLLSSLQLGKPIVAVDEPLYRRVIQGHSEEDRSLGECGLFINAGSPQEIAHAVGVVLRDRKLSREMSRIAGRRFETYYSRQTGFKTYESLYRNYM